MAVFPLSAVNHQAFNRFGISTCLRKPVSLSVNERNLLTVNAVPDCCAFSATEWVRVWYIRDWPRSLGYEHWRSLLRFAGDFRMVLYGVIVLVIVVVFPRGIEGVWTSLSHRWRRRAPADVPHAGPS